MRWLAGIVVVAVVAAGLPLYLASRSQDIEIAGLPSAKDAIKLGEEVSGGDAKDADSFYTAKNLRRALTTLRERVGADATADIKIEQKALKVTATPKGADTTSVVIGASGTAVETPFPGFPVEGPRLSAVNADAVGALAQKVTNEAGIKLQDIAYFTTAGDGGAARWLIFLDDKRRFEAKVNGSGLKALP